jgi:hypothetical protein
MKRSIYILLLSCLYVTTLNAQHSHDHTHESRKIVFPDVPGYEVLSTDLHIHTVFSDGSVWPDIRVEEAKRDNIDVIAITEHLEYQPHEEDIPHPDRNRSYEVAQKSSGQEDSLIIINGSEITRDMPPGHSNAIFIRDANRLLQESAMAVFREAKQQESFVFWNHPHWTAQAPDGIASLTEMHKQLIEEGLLNGIEVVNSTSYSAEALQIALDHDLTILGTSDIHGLIDWQYDVPHGGHRPVTLVFAEERSKESVKQGLVEGRTVVWFNDFLIGKEEYLVPLIEESLTITDSFYQDDTSVFNTTITNKSSSKFILKNSSKYSFHQHSSVITVPPQSSIELQVKTIEKKDEIQLPFEVMNAVTAPEVHPTIPLTATNN